MANRAGLANEDMEFVQFHPTGNHARLLVSVGSNSGVFFGFFFCQPSDISHTVRDIGQPVIIILSNLVSQI